MLVVNPYDELHYRCFPIEWSAPERLALASMLHGGPRKSLGSYRVLELGCGNGANLLPLAFYRRCAEFVGVDGARSQVDIARSRALALNLPNVEFIHADFSNADALLRGRFDFILAHGIFSWVPIDVRDSLFSLCASRLEAGGLLYLNYNCYPGWKIRGLVRSFLLARTAGTIDLRARAESAKELAARVASACAGDDQHPYSRLIANEFRFVCENDVSHIAHEYLAADNHAYWRSEFLRVAARHGLEYVADADFNYPSSRVTDSLQSALLEQQIASTHTLDDAVDLLCYRQLHSPILSRAPVRRVGVSVEEVSELWAAARLTPCAVNDGEHPTFLHASGYRVEAKEEAMRAALAKLHPLWPRGIRVGELFTDVRHVLNDLQLLQRNGLIELRCNEPSGDHEMHGESLHHLELAWAGYVTTPYHTIEAGTAADQGISLGAVSLAHNGISRNERLAAAAIPA